MTAADWDMKMLALEKGRDASADAYNQLSIRISIFPIEICDFDRTAGKLSILLKSGPSKQTILRSRHMELNS